VRPMATLNLRSVSKSFGATKVLHDIDLAIRDKEFVVFVGPSGCGKSTLLRIVAGLEAVTSGKVLIDGRDVSLEPPVQRGIDSHLDGHARRHDQRAHPGPLLERGEGGQPLVRRREGPGGHSAARRPTLRRTRDQTQPLQQRSFWQRHLLRARRQGRQRMGRAITVAQIGPERQPGAIHRAQVRRGIAENELMHLPRHEVGQRDLAIARGLAQKLPARDDAGRRHQRKAEDRGGEGPVGADLVVDNIQLKCN
jgi:ABC-type branched-subunit amino acid transport system ATPase component